MVVAVATENDRERGPGTGDERGSSQRERHLRWGFGVRSLDPEVLEQSVAGGDGVVFGAYAVMLRVVMR
jgi:hypothetical protein